jgi:hypothetical protein
MNDFQKTVNFPLAVSDAFGYNGAYYSCDTLKNGVGYWLKFDSSIVVSFSGNLITNLSIDIHSGWNLIGSISEPIATTSITSDPPGIVTSSIFGYNGMYTATDTIYPGSGYWIRVNQNGRLILDTKVSTSAHAMSRIKIGAPSEMPPSPPGGDGTISSTLPQVYSLEQAYPSPFNPSTTIKYSLPQDNRVTLRVYNILGQVIATLADELQSAGYKSATWTATGAASGIYFYRLEASSLSDPGKSFTQVKKMVLVK